MLQRHSDVDVINVMDVMKLRDEMYATWIKGILCQLKSFSESLRTKFGRKTVRVNNTKVKMEM